MMILKLSISLLYVYIIFKSYQRFILKLIISNSIMIEQLRKKFPYTFVILIFLILAFEYVVQLKLVWIDLQPSSTVGIFFFLLIYHITVVMLIWSFVKTMISEPGRVPTYWGYYLNDPENKKKKYCLICHVFKPQRTHHCTTCGKCILNMDHHCPWINNCVGFYNRKFFILMLFYTTITSLLQAIGIVVSVPKIVQNIKNHVQAVNYIYYAIILIAFIINMVILITIVLFLKFHLQLILSNTTTIQTLQLKRSGKPESQPANYNIGKYYNWVQVFGKNHWQWPLPLFFDDQGPAGDGVLWPKHNENLSN